jgi:SAM-dependent methyltransferase
MSVAMRTTIRKLIERLVTSVEFREPIYEFGSFQVRGQERQAIRPLFRDRNYVGCDMREGPGVDRVLDLEKLDLPDGSVGTAIVLETVEHVRHVWKAADELHRVLEPGGLLVMTSQMYFPIHAYPSDYWRFTPEAFATLCERFDAVVVEYAGLTDFPHTVVACAVKAPCSEATKEQLRQALADWKRNDATSWKEIAAVIAPPFVLAPLYKLFTRLASLSAR